MASTPGHRRNVEVELHDLVGNDLNGQPAPGGTYARTVSYVLPQGTVINLRHRATCSADALDRRGPAACPTDSRVGGGQALADLRPLLPTFVPAELQLFNGKDSRGRHVLLANQKTTLGVTVVTVLTMTRGNATRGPSFTVDYGPLAPATSSTAGLGGNYTQIQLDVTFSGSGADGSYFQAPSTCRGAWTFKIESTNYDGDRSTTVDRTPCVRSRR